MRAISILMFLFIVFLTSNARANEGQFEDIDKNVLQIHGKTPFFRMHVEDVFETRSINMYYFGSNKLDAQSESRWIVARFVQNKNSSITEIDYIDSIKCDRVHPMLWELYSLRIASFDVPGITPPRPMGVESRGIPTHGPSYTLWGTVTDPEGGFAWINLRLFGGQAAAWGVRAEELLRGCWQSYEPSAL
ncbi:hypothetical protein [Brevundimonas sp. 357]|uniref:hypothetical protein n=1 Tax=Brevundimonas sp. 357 TaxID=2555782 RepID=UPI0014050563|nr:hypothetical protein [Brevundimonas sp. 357]